MGIQGLDIESFESRLRRKLERAIAILFVSIPIGIGIILFSSVQSADTLILTPQLYALGALSILTGVISLVVRWDRLPSEYYLSVIVSAITLTIGLLDCIGEGHGELSNLFFIILLASGVYFKGDGVFLTMFLVLTAHYYCVSEQMIDQSIGQYLFTFLAYIAIVWLTHMSKTALLYAKEQQTAMEIASGVAHEISQPLLVIKGSAQRLKQQNDGSQNRAELQTIMDQAFRIQQNLQKLQQITEYHAKEYLPGMRIMDVDRSSKKNVKSPKKNK